MSRTGGPTAARWLAAWAIILAAALVTGDDRAPAAAAEAPVRVLYAGSLVNIMERDLAPAFTRQTGIAVLGRAGGSTALAYLIRDGLVPADVFVSADPAVNTLLASGTGAPSVPWFLAFGSTTMVVAYAPGSPFAPRLGRAVDPGPGAGSAASRSRAWFRILAAPGLRLGRTDPMLDPKGYRTLFVLRLAEQYYHEPGLAERLLGGDENTVQIFPEEALLGRLASGQLDAGFFYLVEAVAQHLPYIGLPPAINLGDPAWAAAYAKVSYADPKGRVHHGAPILYTVAIPSSARNAGGAVRFVGFLLGRDARALLAARGILAVPVRAGGEAAALPAPLRPFVTGRYRP
ncbi:MAG TPA: extracellular solute-binding protein [bacterium]|nr:extracellular solute-binding protein [bacterium]